MNQQNPAEQRQQFAKRLEAANVPPRRFIDVRDGEKGTRTPGHQEVINWLDADDSDLRGNYGVHPGHGLIEFDVDDYDDEHDTEKLDALPETFTVESPHTDDDAPGHRYYAVEDDDETKAVLKEIAGTLNPEPTWGEVKYDGKYVVGPGSQLDGCSKEWCDECNDPDGGYYRIAENRPIATLSADDIAEVLRADPEFSADDSGQAAATDVFDLDPEEEDTTANDADEWLGVEEAKELLDHIDPDLPSPEWVRIGFGLANHFPDGTAERLFEEWSRGGSKWDAEAERRVSSIIGDASGDVGIATVIYHGEQGGWDASAAAREATAATDGGVTAKSPDQGGSPDTGPDADTGGNWDRVMALFESGENGSTTKGYAAAAKVLTNDHDFVTIRETGEMYFYDPEKGHYVRKGRTFIEELLAANIPGHTNSTRVKNIYETVRAQTYISSDEFHPPKGKANVANGVLDLDTRELEPHSPDYYFTSVSEAARDPEAEAPRWDQFLDESVSPEAKKKIEEYIGYTLETWHHNREKNMFIVGPRQSGKSTCADTIQELHGQMPTVSNLTPQQIADTQFDVSALQEASLNTVNDINASKIEDTGTLKRTFSGERQKLERKFQDAQFGALNAKHLFTANWLPRVVGEDESLFRRVLIVEFPNKVDDDERDLQLKDDLKDELDGILNRALDARDRLKEQGRFTADRSDTETRRKWDSWRDAHKRFLYQQFEITGNSAQTVDKETYYQAYKEYSARSGYELKPKQAVTKALQWVPEVDVRDDEYAGLVWNSGDAADTGSSEASTHPPQGELVTKVKGWVEAFATPVTPAQREEILDHAEQKGEDVDKVEHTIDKLCKSGDIWKPEDGGLRPS